MTRDDLSAFTALWQRMTARYDKSMDSESMSLDFKALMSLTIEEVGYGLTCHLQHPTECRFHPFPGQIIGHVTAAREAAAKADGRPDPEEAFTMAMAGGDEANTVVWTEEVGAAFAVARVHLAEGNTIAARMAFKEVYSRAIDEARKARRPAKWVVSEGHDPTRRIEAVKAAQAAGRLIAVDPDLMTLPAPQKNATLSLPGPAPGDSAAAAAGKAALLALANRMKAAPPVASEDAAAKLETRERARSMSLQVDAHAAKENAKEVEYE